MPTHSHVSPASPSPQASGPSRPSIPADVAGFPPEPGFPAESAEPDHGSHDSGDSYDAYDSYDQHLADSFEASERVQARSRFSEEEQKQEKRLLRRGRLTDRERERLASRREDQYYAPSLPQGADRWSTWGDGELGPEPRPAWLVVSDGAVDTRLGVVKTGKEADVHLVERWLPSARDGSGGQFGGGAEVAQYGDYGPYGGHDQGGADSEYGGYDEGGADSEYGGYDQGGAYPAYGGHGQGGAYPELGGYNQGGEHPEHGGYDSLGPASEDRPSDSESSGDSSYGPHPVAASCLLAEKIYRSNDHRNFHRDAAYVDGRRTRESRMDRAVANRTRFGLKIIAEQWAVAEFAALGALWAAGAPVPYPVQRVGTELLLEFIGDADGSAAPRLAALRPDAEELADLWGQLVAALQIVARAGYAHGDLSPWNILVHNGRLVLIDLPQIVDLTVNPRGDEYLVRDVRNVATWFAARGLPDAERRAEELLSTLRYEARLI